MTMLLFLILSSVVLSLSTVLQLSFAQNSQDAFNSSQFQEYLRSLNPRSTFEKITNDKQNNTDYENTYLRIKFSYTPFKLPSQGYISEPSGFEEGCFSDRFGCWVTVGLKVGSLDIHANILDESHFSESCNCDTLEEYRNYRYKIIQEVSRVDEQMYGKGIGNWTWTNDNQTTIGSIYPAIQYEYITPGKIKGEASSCDHALMKHYGVLTKVDDIFYRIEHSSCAKPEVYDKFFPEVKKIFDSIEFFPPQQTLPLDNNDNSFSDRSGGSNSLEILSHNSFIDILGFLHVVGEVKNTTPLKIEFVEIIATFYDSNNEVVGTKSTYANPSDIPGGDTAPFEILLTSASIPISEIDNYKLIASHQ